MDNFNLEINDKVEKTKSFFSGPKIIFAILGVILIIEIIYAVRVLNAPVPLPPAKQETVITRAPAKISLNSAKTSIKVNEIIPVSATLDSGGRSLNGADLVIRFDPKILEATPGGLVRGEIFEEYPLLSLDAKNGLISVSGIGNFKGIGRLVTVNFRAKATGSTSLTIDFVKGLTSDSNLVEAGTSSDILENVNNLELDIK